MQVDHSIDISGYTLTSEECYIANDIWCGVNEYMAALLIHDPRQ